nr:hypothetical protein [Saccharospirillum impatiens]
MMLSISTWLRSIRIKTLYLVAPLLMFSSFLLLKHVDSLLGYVLFFSIMSLAKAIGKPFSRTALNLVTPDSKKKRVFINISLAQNSAIVLAPLVGMLSIGSENLIYNFMGLVYLAFALLSFFVYSQIDPLIKGNSESLIKGISSIFKVDKFPSLTFGIFACYMIMGIFITGIVTSGQFIPAIENHIGILFSLVGVVICIWQFYLSKTRVGEYISNSFSTLLLIIVFSSLFFLGNVYISFLSIMAYGLFESVVIPLFYRRSSDRLSAKYQSQAFSVLLISANVGEAIGAYATGWLIDFNTEMASFYLLGIVSMLGLSIMLASFKDKA